jgi:hypothetical protein
MPGLDAIVCGSVAVTRDGRRCGKGEGYSDLEFAILRELGHPPVPVATTVHDLQVVTSVPRDPTDQPLSVIATPTHAIRIKRPSAAPTGIDWTRLSAEDLEEMPILVELKRMAYQAHFRRLVVQLFEPIDAVWAAPHHLAGLADIAELLGQFQQSDLCPDNLLLLGHVGARRSWPAIRCLFVPALTLVAQLAKRSREGRLDDHLAHLGKRKLLMVDEFGYLPLEPNAAHLFF